jgi:ABC-type sugar transport system ATPase subunit
MEVAAAVCDRVLVMYGGRIVAGLDRAEASEQRILDLAMQEGR